MTQAERVTQANAPVAVTYLVVGEGEHGKTSLVETLIQKHVQHPGLVRGKQLTARQTNQVHVCTLVKRLQKPRSDGAPVPSVVVQLIDTPALEETSKILESAPRGESARDLRRRLAQATAQVKAAYALTHEQLGGDAIDCMLWVVNASVEKEEKDEQILTILQRLGTPLVVVLNRVFEHDQNLKTWRAFVKMQKLAAVEHDAWHRTLKEERNLHEAVARVLTDVDKRQAVNDLINALGTHEDPILKDRIGRTMWRTIVGLASAEAESQTALSAAALHELRDAGKEIVLEFGLDKPDQLAVVEGLALASVNWNSAAWSGLFLGALAGAVLGGGGVAIAHFAFGVVVAAAGPFGAAAFGVITIIGWLIGLSTSWVTLDTKDLTAALTRLLTLTRFAATLGYAYGSPGDDPTRQTRFAVSFALLGLAEAVAAETETATIDATVRALIGTTPEFADVCKLLDAVKQLPAGQQPSRTALVSDLRDRADRAWGGSRLKITAFATSASLPLAEEVAAQRVSGVSVVASGKAHKLDGKKNIPAAPPAATLAKIVAALRFDLP